MPYSSIPVDASWRERSAMPYHLVVGFVLAALATLLIAFFTYQSSEERAGAVGKMNDAVEAVTQIQRVMAILKNAEVGERNFLLTGKDRDLEPYQSAKAALDTELGRLRDYSAQQPQQLARLKQMERLASQRMDDLAENIVLKRTDTVASALEPTRADRQRQVAENIRALSNEMVGAEQEEFVTRRTAWEQEARFAAYFTWGSSTLLLLLIAASAMVAASDYRTKMRESWIKNGLMGLSTRLQGEHRLHDLGQSVLEYLCTLLEAKVGAAYVSTGTDEFERFGGYALVPQAALAEKIATGHGLAGQAIASQRILHVRNVPQGYLRVTSSTGSSTPVELVLLPAVLNQEVYAVIELGFFRPLSPVDLELLERSADLLAIAIRSSADRTRLEELLEETQRQSEELQAQQEELRVNNEELEQQSRILQESQAQMEAQQSELEQSNAQLEEQAQQLQHQKDKLLNAQDDLTQKAHELELASQYKSEFLANMSHELRTPLNSSLILSKLLADNKNGNLSPEQVKYAQTISAAGHDLLALINDILDLAKIEAGQATVSIERITIAKAVQSLVDPFQPLAQEKGLALSATIDPSAPATFETDAMRLGQVIKNLLSNALKFTDKGEVELKVSGNRNGNGTVTFAVRDTGIGIATGQQDLIFDAFRQADGSTHRKYGGTGLGLSISRDIAHLLGGQLTVQSAPAEGSTFTLVLPTKPVLADALQAPKTNVPPPSAKPVRPVASEQQSSRPASPISGHAAASAIAAVQRPSPVLDDRDHLKAGTRTILVVEDDVRFARILQDLSHEMGFQCLVALTAGDGLTAAKAHLPSAIVLDVNLPDFSGLGVLDQLKQNPATRHIPVHVVSVADYAQEALDRGAVGYALKPVKREELVQALQRLEAKFTQNMRRVLVVEDDARQRESVRELLANGDVEIIGADTAGAALELLRASTFDCMVMDMNLPDLSGYELLEQMASCEDLAFPPVIVYTGRTLSRNEEQQLRRFSKSIIVKDARSPERLLDEVTLFLHQVEATLPAERRRMLQAARNRESMLEGRTVLVVEDDVRNVFALSSVLEPTGIKVEIARNGIEALAALERTQVAGVPPIDLILMDIMMPEMDGFTAMQEIRKQAQWRKLPIIALTAKAMKDDQEKCLAAGANDYIAKPLDVEKLLSLIRVWMPK